MSARQVMYYQAQCDCCGLVYDDYGDFSAFSDPDTAIDNVSEDWAQVGGEDLCEACWCWPEYHPDYPGDNEWTGGDDPIRAHDAHPRPNTPQVIPVLTQGDPVSLDRHTRDPHATHEPANPERNTR